MRSHPVVGVLFLLVGGALVAAGALGSAAPPFLRRLPLPADLLVPLAAWQLATWAILFGVFFLRPRGPPRARRRLFARI